MAIPASEIVSVNPRLIAAGGTDLAINGLLLTKNTLIPSSMPALVFANADGVAEYFGENSDEYKFAVKYFLGYDNSFAKPLNMVVARRFDTAVPAFLRGGKFSGTLESIKAISDGAMTLTIDETEVELTGLNFSSATSLSAVADIIETAIESSVSGVTVEYSSLTKAFTITSPTSGPDSDVSFAVDGSGGAVASVLKLTEGVATRSPGVDALSVAGNFRMIRTASDNWVTFSTVWEASASEALEMAQWAGDQGVDFLYVCWSTDEALLDQGSAETVADLLNNNNVGATCGIYGGMAYAAFIMGTAASINWNRRQGTINFAFKGQNGLAATVDSATEADTLMDKKNWNFYGNYATRNDQFTFMYDGRMFGDYKYIDPYINSVWFKNALQVSIMNGLNMAGRVPYNEEGYALIRAWCMDPINRAFYNGVIDAGVTLSETQKAQVYQELGMDVSQELFTNGYVLVVSEPSPQIRVNRESPDVSLYYTYGGSVNKITVASTVLL